MIRADEAIAVEELQGKRESVRHFASADADKTIFWHDFSGRESYPLYAESEEGDNGKWHVDVVKIHVHDPLTIRPRNRNLPAQSSKQLKR